MANEKQTAAAETNKNTVPFIIIGLIILTTIAGIYWISQSGEKTDNGNNTAANSGANSTQEPANNYANAPAGALPEHFKGSESALVVVEEFADYQCPACGTTHPIFNEINSIYGSKIKFVFRNYPLIQAHPKAYDAAVAAEAAGFQDKFWEMQNMLFSNQGKWSTEADHRKTFEEYAKTLGLDVDKFKTDSLGLNAKNRVDTDMRRGNALDLRSTPSLYINGKSLVFEQMTVEGIKAAIDAELARVSPKAEEPSADESNANATETNNTSEEKENGNK